MLLPSKLGPVASRLRVRKIKGSGPKAFSLSECYAAASGLEAKTRENFQNQTLNKARCHFTKGFPTGPIL